MSKPSKALRIQRAARAALREAGIEQVFQEAMRTSAAGAPGSVRIARHRDDHRFDPPRSPAEAGARWLTLRVEVPALASMDGGEVIPPEETADPVIQAVKTAMQSIRDGQNLLIFPEGTVIRNGIGKTDGLPAHAHSGAAVIGVRTGAILVPVFVDGEKQIGRAHV